MRPVTECDTRLRAARIDVHKFQSTHSITECDAGFITIGVNWRDISIHALHYRVRLVTVDDIIKIEKFQSTHSITECDASDPICRLAVWDISIHALHYRVRRHHYHLDFDTRNISIHALHYRVRPVRVRRASCWPPSFQSTHSITECDFVIGYLMGYVIYFNPRTPLQSATVTGECKFDWLTDISIHALHYRVRQHQ